MSTPSTGSAKTGTDVQVGAVCAAFVEGVDLLNPQAIDWAVIAPRVLKLHPEAREWIDHYRNSTRLSGSSDGVFLERASGLRPEALDWLWFPRIAIGMITLLVGVPGLGKTLLALWLAAELTRGRLPDALSDPADVVIASAEDHKRAVLVPRLKALDADMDRVHFVGVRHEGIEEDITSPTISTSYA